MRYLKWISLGLIALLACAAIWFREPFPSTLSAGDLRAAAANYDAEIIRDNWGVPHIYGQRDADVSFGLAYAHAEDDFETIQETVAATRGRLARYRGAGAAPTDYIVALFGVWDIIDERYESDVPADVRAIADAYAAGMNLYASENPDATWPGLPPFTGKDVVAGFVFKTPFFYGLDSDLLELFGEERNVEIALDPGEGRKAFMIAPKRIERGSNAIAVAPQRSGDGVTRLMINSHQPMTGPVAWYEAHLKSEEGLDIMGGLFPGTPLILHGFNRDLGWANTVSEQDLADIYRLEINPENKMQYKLDGEWRSFDVETIPIAVKIWGPFVYTSKQKVLRSEHGPVIQAKHGAYALRYAGMGEIRQLEQYYRLNQSGDLDSFMTAMEMNALPSINYIYADKVGNIAFIHNGQYPNRIEGWDWSTDLPGDRSDLIWQGYRPYSAVPKLINPDSGLVFNSNNTPYVATDGGDNLRAEDFPSSMGLQTNHTNRSLRMMELTNGQSPIDETALLALKFDTGIAKGSQADQVIKAALSQDWSDDERLQAASEHLAAWDRQHDIANRHAALGALTVVHEVTARFTHIPAPQPADAFRQAVEYLHTHHGRIDPEYGDVNRLVRGTLNVPISGGPDILRAIYPAEIRDDGQMYAAAGDTWIGLVEWDAEGNQSARMIHQYGSATLNEASSHYADQAEMFAKEEWRTALLDRADVESNATRTYRPGKK